MQAVSCFHRFEFVLYYGKNHKGVFYGIFKASGIRPPPGARRVFFRRHIFGRRAGVHGAGAAVILVRRQAHGVLCVRGGSVRYARQPVSQNSLPRSPAVGARPRLYDRRVCARGGHGVLVSVRAHAERRRHVWRHRPSGKAQMGKHRVPRAGPSCAVFANVSGGSHAAGRGRGIPDGGNSARGVLPHFPLGRKNQRCHAVSSRGGHCAGNPVCLLCQRHPRRLCPRLGGCEQSRACGQKRMDASGCNCGASYGLPCRPENAAV